MNHFVEGFGALLDIGVVANVAIGVLIGMLVGAFPGVTATMTVALAGSLTLTMEPVEGMAVLLAIYVAANFGDRVPAILINAPGTPASIATTFDGFPMAQRGKAGLALSASAMVSAIGGLASVVVFIFLAEPIAGVALKFGPAELFALMLFGLTMMIGVSGSSVTKGLLAGGLGLLIATIGRDPISGETRFTFGSDYLTSGIPLIPVLMGLFGLAEILDQIATAKQRSAVGNKPIAQLGRWWPNRREVRRMGRPVVVGTVVGTGVGALPAAGGDIAGLLSWEGARRVSKHPEEFGKGSIEGVAASDTASNSSLGGSLTTSMTLGIPGDAVMAVIISMMVIWGLQPGPKLLQDRPDLVGTIGGIMIVATLLSLLVSLMRLRGMVKLMSAPPQYIWMAVLMFCMVGSYSLGNNVIDVVVMLVAGLIGLALRRLGAPAGPVVLGILLGPLAEANLRRALLIESPADMATRPIVLIFVILTVLALTGPMAMARWRGSRARRTASEVT